MKTTVILTLFSFLWLSTPSFAGNGETLFKKKVNSKIKYPEQISKKVETEVYVQFSVTEAGEIVIDSISSESEEINTAIAEQLKELKVSAEDKDVIGKTFYYRFLLKVQ
jgi:hypothetical protein